MNDKRFHIAMTYVYHAFSVVLALILLREYADVLLGFSLIVGILYWLYWIICNRKGYMPWIVYLNFLCGTAIAVFLNWSGIIPEDQGFLTGLGQALLIVFLLLYAALIGLTKLILWLIDQKIRQRKQG